MTTAIRVKDFSHFFGSTQTLKGIDLDVLKERDPGGYRPGRQREIDLPRRPQPDERPHPQVTDGGYDRDRRKEYL